jgi:hypothetical protein
VYDNRSVPVITGRDFFSNLKITGKKVAVVVAGLIIAIAVYGGFNFLLNLSYPGLAVLFLILLPIVWWIAEKRIRAALLSEYGYAPAALKEK